MVYFASLLDLLQADAECLVIGVDLRISERARTVTHPRVRLLEGSSTSPEVLRMIKRYVPAAGAMVSLDSDHSRDHVLAELKLYSDFVGAGSYLVVEDMNINGHPVGRTSGPGPFEAVEEFLRVDTRFERDDALWQRNLISFHHHGWLKRRI
jgi:cephalosporin hydroxylase